MRVREEKRGVRKRRGARKVPGGGMGRAGQGMGRGGEREGPRKKNEGERLNERGALPDTLHLRDTYQFIICARGSFGTKDGH